MALSSSIFKYCSGLVLAAILLAIVTMRVWPHYWKVVPTAAIAYNGKPSDGSHLYGSTNGEFILHLQEPQEYSPYWIVPKRKQVSVANINNFNFGNFAVLVHHTDQYGVDLTDTVKTEVNPKIVTGKNSIEFAGRLKQRVSVTW